MGLSGTGCIHEARERRVELVLCFLCSLNRRILLIIYDHLELQLCSLVLTFCEVNQCLMLAIFRNEPLSTYPQFNLKFIQPPEPPFT